MKRIILSNKSKLYCIDPKHIVFAKISNNYLDIYLRENQKPVTFIIGLEDFHELIHRTLGEEEGRFFIRVGKSIIINIAYLHEIETTAKKILPNNEKNENEEENYQVKLIGFSESPKDPWWQDLKSSFMGMGKKKDAGILTLRTGITRGGLVEFTLSTDTLKKVKEYVFKLFAIENKLR